jgi:hypothetical protein
LNSASFAGASAGMRRGWAGAGFAAGGDEWSVAGRVWVIANFPSILWPELPIRRYEKMLRIVHSVAVCWSWHASFIIAGSRIVMRTQMKIDMKRRAGA